MTNCPYTGRCISEGTCCGHCGNNQSLKEDYFIPRRRHHYYHPLEYPYIKWGTTPSSPSTTGNYYQER